MHVSVCLLSLLCIFVLVFHFVSVCLVMYLLASYSVFVYFVLLWQGRTAVADYQRVNHKIINQSIIIIIRGAGGVNLIGKSQPSQHLLKVFGVSVVLDIVVWSSTVASSVSISRADICIKGIKFCDAIIFICFIYVYTEPTIIFEC